MNAAGLTYGDAGEVHNFLMEASGITLEQAVSALANAMNRIAMLEKRLNKAEDRILELEPQ